MPILDPKSGKVTTFRMPVADRDMPESLGTRPCREHEPAGALALLGRGKALGHARQQSQRHVRQAGPGVDGRHRARQGQSRVLQEGIEPSLGEGLRARAVLAAGGDARSEDDEIHLRRHLLRHASSAVRLRRRQYPVALRHGAGGGLGEHPGIRSDRRRGAGAGLVAVRPRYQRQRPARRVRRAQPADRSGQGQAHRARLRPVRGDAEPGRRFDLVHGRSVLRRAGLSALRPEDAAVRGLSRVPRPPSASAAATSTRTAWPGARRRAGTW